MKYFLILLLAGCSHQVPYELESIKQRVDARTISETCYNINDKYDFNCKKRMLAMPINDGTMAGNCILYARRYAYEAQKVGFTAKLQDVTMFDKNDHIVAVVLDSDGKQYIMDNVRRNVVLGDSQ